MPKGRKHIGTFDLCILLHMQQVNYIFPWCIMYAAIMLHLHKVVSCASFHHVADNFSIHCPTLSTDHSRLPLLWGLLTLAMPLQNMDLPTYNNDTGPLSYCSMVMVPRLLSMKEPSIPDQLYVIRKDTPSKFGQSIGSYKLEDHRL